MFYKVLSNMSVCDQTQKNRRRDQKLCAETIGKPLRRQPKITRKSHRRNKPRTLVRKLTKCSVSGSKNDVRGVPGRVRQCSWDCWAGSAGLGMQLRVPGALGWECWAGRAGLGVQLGVQLGVLGWQFRPKKSLNAERLRKYNLDIYQ